MLPLQGQTHRRPRVQTCELRRIEVLDEAVAEALRRKTPAGRLAIGFGLCRSARILLLGQLASLHPEWNAAQLSREVARRLSHGAP